MLKDTTIPKRAEVAAKDKWHTEDLFPSDAAWESAYKAAEQEITALSAHNGIFTSSAAALLGCLNDCNRTAERLDRLYVYANLRFHEDSTNSVYQTLSDRAELLAVSYSSASSFLLPQLLALPEDTLSAYQEQEPGLAVYTHYFENIRRQKAHTLSAKEENLLAEAAVLGESPSNIFTMLNDADLSFPDILADGKPVPLTKGRYTMFLENKDRQVRESAFRTLYQTYAKQKNTLGAAYYASVKTDIYFAKARNYPSSLAAALADDAIPLSVYDTLIQAVRKHLPLLHRYIRLRKKMLGLDTLHMYDLYTPLVDNCDKTISFEDAKKTVLEGMAPLGESYQKALSDGFNGGWIDVYENQGKRGGAYSWGAYPGHPYVLLNHNDTFNSMFTLAHEMGHALHSYFTWKTQPFLYSGHKIFVAEVASTVNEALLMEHLLKTTTDKNTRLYLLNYFMEQFRGTFFRQTMFAEFEKTTHEMAENGQPLNFKNLSSLYYKLNQDYFGTDIEIDQEISLEWARIPHFYNAFYVYQYATGYSAAVTLSRRILKEGASARDAYLAFLSKGNSEYSIDLLKGAGVDMTTQTPFETAMTVFEAILAEMETESGCKAV